MSRPVRARRRAVLPTVVEASTGTALSTEHSFALALSTREHHHAPVRWRRNRDRVTEIVDDRIGGHNIKVWSTRVPIIPRVVDVTVVSIPEGLEETLTQVAWQHKRRLRLRTGTFGDDEFVPPIGFIREGPEAEATDEDMRRLILLTIEQEQFPLDVRQEATRRLEAGEPPRAILDWLSRALGFDDDVDHQ